MKITVLGYHLGDRLDLKLIKNSFTFNCIYADPTELIYEIDSDIYFRIFDYGSIVFLGVDNTVQIDIISSIRRILRLEVEELMSETFDIEIDCDMPYQVLFNKLIVRELNVDIAKIIMLNIAQSVALDYYVEQSDILLAQITQYSVELEEQGRISIKGRKLLKVIGRTLNLKNKIVKNLYIFDSPTMTWNDEFLNLLNYDLGRELDIKIRHKSLEENLNTVKENLDILKDINQHSHSSFLEVIVILLIAFEVLNVLLQKIF